MGRAVIIGVVLLVISVPALADGEFIAGRRPSSGFVDPELSREFDEVDDWVDMGDQVEFDIGSSNGGYSMCAWIKPDDAGQSAQGRLMDKGGGNSSAGWTFQLNSETDKQLAAQIDNGGLEGSDHDVWSAGTWMCACMTQEGTGADDLKFWADGVEVSGLGAVGWPTAGTWKLYIGARESGSSREFDGRMAYVQLWDELLSASELSDACDNPCSHTSNLVGAWTLTDDSSTQTDYSSNSNDGTTNGTTRITGDGPPITEMSCS